MKLLAVRFVILAVLLMLYFVHPLVGVAGLMAGFGVAVWQRLNEPDSFRQLSENLE